MTKGVDVLRAEHSEIAQLFGPISDPAEDRIAVLGELVPKMAAHLSAEQAILLPAVKAKGIGGGELVRGLKSDYRQIERLLVRIERRKGSSPDLPGMVTKLIDLFEIHTRRCDLQMYPAMEASFGGGELDELVERMRSGENVILSHPHPHLLSLGPLSRFTTRLAAVHDRLRDRTVPATGLRSEVRRRR